LRPSKAEKVEAVLKNGYGDQFDYSRFVAARREITDELGERLFNDTALSVRRRTKASEIHQRTPENQKRREDFER
jgi:hypothetical protein